jgi:hypothetical protein
MSTKKRRIYSSNSSFIPLNLRVREFAPTPDPLVRGTDPRISIRIRTGILVSSQETDGIPEASSAQSLLQPVSSLFTITSTYTKGAMCFFL